MIKNMAKRIVITALAAFMMLGLQPVEASANVSSMEQQEKKVKKAKAEIKEAVFHVHLHCASCIEKISENVSFEKGVKGLDISQETNTVKIKYDSSKTSETVLKAVFAKLGYPVEDGPHHHGHDKCHN